MSHEREFAHMQATHGAAGTRALDEIEDALRHSIDDGPGFARRLVHITNQCGEGPTIAALRLVVRRLDDMLELVGQTPEEALSRSRRSVATVRAMPQAALRAILRGLRMFRS